MNRYQVLAVMGLSFALAACGTTNRDDIAGLSASGGNFNAALHQEYLALGDAERAEYDWTDSDYFYDKSRRAALGEEVMPAKIDERSLPGDAVAGLTTAREKLIAALFGGGKDKAPMELAKAQANYDCWMQEQEENFQPEDIAACRGNFELALQDAEKKLAPPPVAVAPEPKKAEPKPDLGPDGIYLVHFDFDVADLTGKAMDMIATAVQDFWSAKPEGIKIEGHTDRAGTEQYNEALATRRALAVANAMITAGVPADIIRTESMGEEKPLRITKDGERDEKNRRAEITFD